MPYCSRWSFMSLWRLLLRYIFSPQGKPTGNGVRCRRKHAPRYRRRRRSDGRKLRSRLGVISSTARTMLREESPPLSNGARRRRSTIWPVPDVVDECAASYPACVENSALRVTRQSSRAIARAAGVQKRKLEIVCHVTTTLKSEA